MEEDISRREIFEQSGEMREGKGQPDRPKTDCISECLNDAWDLKSESECTAACQFTR
jgi:hypothetical protein